ncbi:potassium channel family protein [Pseudoxanthomonas sp.]|jgi:Ion transport protein.|uniref:potassium channel family protein n=1 Tax=Pseudoxanthomonas sp. TaxID=1871049 RepID=UPI002FE35FDF
MSRHALRKKVHIQLDPKAWPGRGLSPANRLLVAAILIATVSAIVGTEPRVARTYAGTFSALELVLGIVFAAEYLARLWSVAERREAGVSPTVERLRFALSPSALLDLLIIVITLVPFFAINVMALRLVRLLRILRLAKLGRMSSALGLLYGVVASRKYELMVTLGLASTLLIFGASALYWIEGDLQPDKFGSIPRALWWAVITLTTIGYGDVYPITPAGKFVAGLVAISGIGLIAMPTGILASAFSEAMRKQ